MCVPQPHTERHRRSGDALTGGPPPAWSFKGARPTDQQQKKVRIPDLLFDDVEFFELKGIRSDGSHSNYNGAAVTGVEKRAASWLVELRNKAVRLDERVFGVRQPALGPFQRRLQEIGGITPLVFGADRRTLPGDGLS